MVIISCCVQSVEKSSTYKAFFTHRVSFCSFLGKLYSNEIAGELASELKMLNEAKAILGLIGTLFVY